MANLVEVRPETPTARTLVLEVPGWPGHLAGQHVDVRLTSEDGYVAERAYSLAAPADGERIELTVQVVGDGEVSPFLGGALSPGDPLEVRGPLGGWFVWRPEDPSPVLLVAGGAGIVPLMAMTRTRRLLGSRVPFRLVYSVRTPADVYYAEELLNPQPRHAGLEVSIVYTREAPPGGPPPSRVRREDLAEHGWPPELAPLCFVCGPTGFVEAMADALVALRHDPARIRTERFGPTGGT
ncbi:MAG TPA: ferredoxin reductase [Jiangellales bacterium]|nr:ferredoxin reductase [Jiangellales bacterium]